MLGRRRRSVRGGRAALCADGRGATARLDEGDVVVIRRILASKRSHDKQLRLQSEPCWTQRDLDDIIARLEKKHRIGFGELRGNAMGQIKLPMILNDDTLTCTVSAHQTLHDLLRDLGHVEMAGEACLDGNCCRCTVLLNNLAVCACQVLAVEAANQRVQTLHHFGSHPLVQHVRAAQGPCGRCLGAHVLTTFDLLRESPQLSLSRLRQRLVAIPCECQLAGHVVRAVSQGLGQPAGPPV